MTSADDTRAGEVAAEEVDLAETLRDERLQPCDHSTKGWPDCCVTCLRDRIIASDWLAAHDARVRAADAAEIERLRQEHHEFTSALGYGDGVTERAAPLADMVDIIEQAFSEASEYREGPRICEPCGEWLAATTCEHCHGSGGNIAVIESSGTYSECEWCAGVGKVHPGCVEASYADLVTQRDEARTERDRLAAGVRELAERITTGLHVCPTSAPEGEFGIVHTLPCDRCDAVRSLRALLAPADDGEVHDRLCKRQWANQIGVDHCDCATRRSSADEGEVG